MRDPLPATPGELQFAEQAEAKLPLRHAEAYRNDGGNLVYRWDSPCQEVEGLWLTIHDQQEIMLSSRLSHTHVECWSVAARLPEGGDVWSGVIEEAISQALEILAGRTVFVKIFDSNGNQESSSGVSPLRLWKDRSNRAEWTKHYGEGWRARAWNWSGQVLDE